MGFQRPISARRLLHSSPASPPGFAWNGAGPAARGPRGGGRGRAQRGEGPAAPTARPPPGNLCIPARSNRSHRTPFRRKWVNSTESATFLFKLRSDSLFGARCGDADGEREAAAVRGGAGPRGGGGAGPTGAAGSGRRRVGECRCSRSRARVPRRQPPWASPRLAPLSPRGPAPRSHFCAPPRPEVKSSILKTLLASAQFAVF